MNCPACEADLDLDVDQLQEGGIIHCDDCGTDSEVVNLHPLELERMHDDDDDEDYDEDDEDFGDDEDEDEEDGYDDEDDGGDDEDEE